MKPIQKNFLFKKEIVGGLLPLSILLLFSISFVSAEVDTTQVTDIFKVNEVISYTEPCINNGTACSGVTVCNFTFYEKNGSPRPGHSNVLPTNVGINGASLWQYNISHQETGFYKVDISCKDGSAKDTITKYYQVTGSGDNDSLNIFLVVLGLAFMILFLGLYMQDPYITMFSSFCLFLISLYVLFNGFGVFKDDVTTYGTGIIMLGISMYVGVRSGMEAMS